MKRIFLLSIILCFITDPTFCLSNKPTSFSSLHHQLMDSTLSDGFDYPVGDKNGKGFYSDSTGKKYNGWIAKKIPFELKGNVLCAGEDWNGKGGGNTDFKQPVYAIGNGKVIFADHLSSNYGKTILIEHRFTENGKIVKVYSFYCYLHELRVGKGELVDRRQQIGAIGINSSGEALLHFEIRKIETLDPDTDFILHLEQTIEWLKQLYEECSSFIESHRQIVLPCKKEKLVLIDKGKFQCYIYQKGNLLRTYEIALGQVPVGAKEKQGDLKVPEGEYAICEKTRGPFSTATNWSAAYLGTRWMCLTYPNAYDAKKALDKKLINQTQYNNVVTASKSGTKPPQNTPLGGGIGLHGWIEEDWSNDSDRALTWGCISFHKNDLNEFYDLVEMKTTVIIIP